MKKFTLKDVLTAACTWTPPEKRNEPIKQSKESPKKKQPIKKEATKDYSQLFIKDFMELARTRSKWTVWDDFITMFACSISNAVDKSHIHWDEREKMYLSIVKKYKKSEMDIFPRLAAYVIEALDKNQEQDFLGELFMNLNLSNEHNGQFFTPYHVCDFMAKITCDVDSMPKTGPITINDPACGAGATLIAAANELRKIYEKRGLNFQNYVLAVAQDIDQNVGLMCYIQLSLLGLAGFVKIGDSLSDPIRNGDDLSNYWFTPMYYSEIWTYRRMFDYLKGDTNEEV
jgi:type I restriction-modification system DNA methylase subunit